MSDDLSNRGPQDRARINIHEEWEVRWWCKELGVTPAELVAAVQAVGVSAEKVRQYLKRPPGPPEPPVPPKRKVG
jgi:hypothetical protein